MYLYIRDAMIRVIRVFVFVIYESFCVLVCWMDKRSYLKLFAVSIF